MQMWLARIAGAANMRQYLPTPHPVTCLDAQTAWLEMHVVGELIAAQIEGDRVSCNRLQRYRNSGMERASVSRSIVGETVPCRDNTAIGDGEHILVIGVVRAHVA